MSRGVKTMRQVPFSIPISGVIQMNKGSVTIVINRAETIISLKPGESAGGRVSLGRGKTTYDVILEAAREIVRRKTVNRFSTPELYDVASEKYPDLNKGSVTSRVIASTPNHPSYKHYSSKRDYFSRIGPGMYKLNDQYLASVSPNEGKVTRNEGKTLFDRSTEISDV